jgi:hypothetical protein
LGQLALCSVGTFKAVVDKRLSASFDTINPVAHGVEACLGGVDLNDVLELAFAALKLSLEVQALEFALLEDEGLGILTVFKHFLEIAGLSNSWVQTRFVNCVAWH